MLSFMHATMRHMEDICCKKENLQNLRVGYFWLTLHKDALRYASSCDDCQRMGRTTRKSEMPL